MWSRQSPRVKGHAGLVPCLCYRGRWPVVDGARVRSFAKVIARLPFVERADHPAAMPVFVISRVAAEPW